MRNIGMTLAVTLGLLVAGAGAYADDASGSSTNSGGSGVGTETQGGSGKQDETAIQPQRGTDEKDAQASIDIKSLKPDQVKQIQQKLLDQGYYKGRVDGFAGPMTMDGLHQFQQAKGLTSGDKLDMQTASALGVDFNEFQTVRGQGSSGGIQNQSGSSSSSGSSDVNGGNFGGAGSSSTGNDTSSGSSSGGAVDQQSGSSSGSTMDQQSGSSSTAPVDKQSGHDTSSGSSNASGSTGAASGSSSSSGQIDNQTGSSDTTGGVTSPDAVDRQNQSGASGSATGTGSSTGVSGDNTGSSGSGVQNQSGRESVQVYDTATIKDVQKALAKQKIFKGKPNGKLDADTTTAIMQFQQKNGLAATGALDQMTLAKLGVTAKSNQSGGTMNNPGSNPGTGTDTGTNNDTGTNPSASPAPSATPGAAGGTSNPY